MIINENIAERVLEAALETGGDFAEIFCEDTVKHNISGLDSQVETAAFSHIHGAGIRILRGDKSAYAYTSDTSEEALIKCARAAGAALKGEKNTYCVTPFTHNNHAIPQELAFSQVANDKRAKLVLAALKKAKSCSEEIVQAAVRYQDEERYIEIYNSLGNHAMDLQPRTRMVMSAVASNGSDTQDGFATAGHTMGFEAYESKIDVEAMAKTAADTAVLMLHADDCPAGRVPVVIDGGFGGVILHEACVHSLEATFISKGNSVFCNKLGQKIASDCVTAIDDGTIPGEYGTASIDDEGYPTQRNVLIENGILKSYLVDRLGSRRMNHRMTGSSRRQDYTVAPTSRMNNTFFAPGKDDEEEMIKTVDEGLFATKMGGGSVNPVTGEFCFAVAEGYWIKNGIIVKPVKGATLVGKGSEILLKIDRVGKNQWLETGTCGSASGMIPVTVGQPRIRVSEITVGGKGGAI